MRYTFLTIFFILLQFLSFGAGRWLQWMLKPYVNASTLPWLMVAVYVVGNGLLLLSFLSFFRSVSWWLALLWLLLLSTLFTALIWWVSKHFIAQNQLIHLIRGVSILSYIGMIGFAIFNAYSPTVRYLNIEIDKPMAKPMTFAMVSDTHLGKMVGNRQLEKLYQILQQNPIDIVLIPGDVMDDDTTVFDKEKMQDNFTKIAKSAKLGAFATLGNHDLYRTHAFESIQKDIQQSGFQLLNDRAVLVDGVWIVGRYDDHHPERAKTVDLLKEIDTIKPVILLDHRPTEIEQHQDLPIDLQVSGHTHDGQVFPANFVVKMMYPLAYGYEQRGKGHYVVSSGFGFWGIPFRLGSRAEVWIITMTGKKA
ncbi:MULTISPECIES: metallophosphoesterase [unclassified Acinetobacter]|uniref:metallophosphoesterase n=1 Tax=unclassified Acinetobacter TaxID=196816 RepID=UPI0035B74C2F